MKLHRAPLFGTAITLLLTLLPSGNMAQGGRGIVISSLTDLINGRGASGRGAPDSYLTNILTNMASGTIFYP